MTVQTGTFSATGQSPGALMIRDFNVTLSGTFAASIAPERSFDGGATWQPFTYADGSAVTWTAALSTALSEPESGVLWRLNCTLSSGAVAWRLSQ